MTPRHPDSGQFVPVEASPDSHGNVSTTVQVGTGRVDANMDPADVAAVAAETTRATEAASPKPGAVPAPSASTLQPPDTGDRYTLKGSV